MSLQTDGSTYKHEYVIKDHLGNTRVTYRDDDILGVSPFGTIKVEEIVQTNHYYPFGLNMEGNWNGSFPEAKNKYQFGGKELNSDFGLDWNDFGVRFYDPAIGRFPMVDKLASNYPYYTPYQYAGNEVVSSIDLDGLEPKRVIEGWKATDRHMYPSGQEIRMIQDPANLGGGSYWVYEKLNKGGYMYYNEGNKSWDDFNPSRYSDNLMQLGNGMSNVVHGIGVTLATGGVATELGLGRELLKEIAIEAVGERIINGTTEGSDVFDIGISTASNFVPGWKGKIFAITTAALIDIAPFDSDPSATFKIAGYNKRGSAVAVDGFTGILNIGIGAKASGSIGRQFGKAAETVTDNVISTYEAFLNKILQKGEEKQYGK